MPLVKITKDCKVSENGIDIIELYKGSEIQVSDGLFIAIQNIESGELATKPKKVTKKKAAKKKPIETESETIE